MGPASDLPVERPGGRRRLLLVSYHFPPSREVGGLRWQKFAKYAAARGWEVDVIALDPANLASPDWDTLALLPATVRVYSVPASNAILDRLVGWLLALRQRLRIERAPSDPISVAAATPSRERPESMGHREVAGPLRSPRDAARAFHAWRDHARGRAWARRAVALARPLTARTRYDAVVSCGPPHMVHDAGRRIAAAARLPFVMDLRDLWSLVPRLPESVASSVWYALARRDERRAVRAATLVITNTVPAARTQQRMFREAHDRIIAVLNGYDDDPVPPPNLGACFVLAYTGSVYLDRDPRLLFRAVGRVVRELSLRPDALRVEFMGANAGYAGETLAALAEQEGIAPYVIVHPSRPRWEAQQLLARAAMLVSLPQDTHTAIPSKIFEYIRFNAWLLALAEPDSATEMVLRDSGADVVGPDDVDAMAAVLRSRYQMYARGARPERPQVSETLSRRVQAARLFDELERRLRDRYPLVEAAPR